MLQLKNLTVELGPAPGARRLLDDINLTVGSGGAVGLVGESGSGKSMTMRTVLRTLPHGARVSGSIGCGRDGQVQDLLALRPEQLRRFRAACVSMISQNPQAALNPVLPVKKFLIEGVQAAKPGTGTAEALQASR
ncbi:ATP-binding cassette domain-containing protein, partial [Arthrobacter deserti]|nr:ATP-binding cassette domain-containing protein [Arthrobacter deserti]